MYVATSQITRVSIFYQPFVQAQIKESIKSLRHWRLWRESTGNHWIRSQMASNTENVYI